jgi:hypothetical protein
MKVGFHPVFDNPIRMGYVSGWKAIHELVERLGDLEHAVGEGKVVPAPWEPYSRECPSCRDAGAYAWAQGQLQDPDASALALALFVGEPEQLATKIGHANWLILCTRSEPSHITRRLMLAEALELWECRATEWLESVVENCSALGVSTAVELLHQQVQRALKPLAKDVPSDADSQELSDLPTGWQSWHGFDKELLQLDGWTPDPGLIILPVDGRGYALTRQILRLDLRNVVLLRARKSARVIPWEKVTLVHLCEGALTFEIIDEPPLVVAGYKHPEQVFATVQGCYRAATERLLQALAAKVIHPTP